MSKKLEIVMTLPEKDLPSGWELATIGNIVGREGVFKDGDWVESKDQDPNGDVRLIQLADIGDGEYRDRSSRFLTYKKALELRCTFIDKGDVLVARMPDPLGRACIFPGDKKKSVTVVDVCIVRPEMDDISKRWLMYFINAPVFRATVASLQSGSTRKRISRKNLAKISLPVPPSDEQKRIVAEIEKQFSRLDEAVDNLKRVKANLKRYKASVLKAAVEGKLTEEWRDKNKADIISENIFDIVSSKRISNYNELCKHAKKTGKPKPKKPSNIDTKFSVDKEVLSSMSSIPKEWRYVHIAFITNDKPDSIVDGPFGSSINVKKDYIESGIPVIRINNIAPFKFINDNLKYLRKEKFGELKRHNILPGDILFGKVGTIGNSCIYPNNIQEGMLSTTGSCRTRVDEDLYYTDFLCLILNAYKPIFNRIASAGVQPFLNMKTIKNFPIPILSLNEQEEIMKHVDVLLSVAERIEIQVDKGVTRAERLRQSILAQAFSGLLIQSKES